MDQGKENSEEKKNKEVSLTKSACKEYKMFLDHVNILKPSLLRNQLSELLYHLYVHLFLQLLREKKCSKYAQEFLKQFHFVAIAKPLEFSIMKNSSTNQQVVKHPLFKSYKKGRKISIRYTESNYKHLENWLQHNQPGLISRLLSENFHPEILKEKLGKADPLIPPANVKDIPPDPGISDESCEECCQDESDLEISDISSVTNGNDTCLQDHSNVEDFSDVSSVTSEKLLDMESAIDSSGDSPEEFDDASPFTSECDSSDSEKSNNLNVEEPHFKTLNTIGVISPDSDELNSVETYDISNKATLANDEISSNNLSPKESMVTMNNCRVIFPNFDGVQNEKNKFTNLDPRLTLLSSFRKTSASNVSNNVGVNKVNDCALVSTSSKQDAEFYGNTCPKNSNMKEKDAIRDCVVQLQRIDISKKPFRNSSNLGLTPLCSSRRIISSFQNTNYSKISTMRETTVRNYSRLTRVDGFQEVFNGSSNLGPAELISCSQKHTSSCERKREIYLKNSTTSEKCVTKRICSVSLNKIDGNTKVFNNSSNSNQLPPIPSRRLPYSFARNKTTSTKEGAKYSQNSTMEDKFGIKDCSVFLTRVDLSKAYNCSIVHHPTSTQQKKLHKDCNGIVNSLYTVCNGYADSNDSFVNNETVSQSEDASSLSITSLNESKGEEDELSCYDDTEVNSKNSSNIHEAESENEGTPNLSARLGKKIKKRRKKWQLCTPCLLKKRFRSTPSQIQSNGSSRIVTDNVARTVVKAIYLSNRKVPFENRLSEKGSCLVEASRINKNCKLERILEKFRMHSSELPYLPATVPPIRVLNIESSEKLHCSVIAKDLSYLACAFENSLYVWKSMDKIPNKYFLSSNPIKLDTRNTFVPTKERVGGVSAFPEKLYTGSLHCLACNPLTNQLLLGSKSTIECWCPITNKCLLKYKFHTDLVNDMCFRPNSPDFISTSMDKRAVVWDFETSIPKCQFSHNEAVMLSGVHPKFPYIATATSREIHIWIDGSPIPQCVFAGHREDITDIAFSPGGTNLVSCDKSGLVNVWDMNKRQEFKSFLVTKQGVGNLCYNSSEKNVILATAGLDNTLRLYSSETPIIEACERIPIFTAECQESSVLSSIQFNSADELVEITYTPKKPYTEYPKAVS